MSPASLLPLQDYLLRGKEVCVQKAPRVATPALATVVACCCCLQSGEPCSFKETQTPFPHSWPQSAIIQTVSCLQLSVRAARGNHLVSLTEEKLKERAQMDSCFLHESGQLVSRGHQAMIVISMLHALAAVAWEVSSSSGIAATFLGFGEQ